MLDFVILASPTGARMYPRSAPERIARLFEAHGA